ncbi:helix-hairpin-helix domain-containing protein [Natrinema sp. CBA1119]
MTRKFDSLDELRASGRDQLEGVHGVGEQMAGAILERRSASV